MTFHLASMAVGYKRAELGITSNVMIQAAPLYTLSHSNCHVKSTLESILRWRADSVSLWFIESTTLPSFD